MLNPWLILGTVAFIASFGISLLMTRDFGGALIAGSSALATGFATAAAVNSYHNRSSESRMAALKHQIRLLQRRRAEEQQAVLEIAAEKERVFLALNSMQDELRQRQLPGSNPYARPALSWNLSSQSADGAQVAIAEGYSEIQPEFHPASLNQFITDAAAAKQKITASLNHLQSELSHLNSQVSDQRQVREQLLQEITQLSQQQQGLTQTAKELTQDIEELERCRTELDQYVVYVETKKQELEAGSNPLQKALKQLQGQVTALQEELRSLEEQVTAKRQEKAALDRGLSSSKQHQAKPLQDAIQTLENQKSKLEREVATLKQQHEQSRILQDAIQKLENQKSQLERDLTHLKQQQSQLKASQDSLQKLEKQINDRRREKESLEKQITQLQAQKTALRNQSEDSKSEAQLELQTEVVASAQNGKGKPALERPVMRPQPQLHEEEEGEGEWEDEDEGEDEAASEQELSELWTEFMLQLPEYELQALKAIAYEGNPTRVLNRIAEDNFTTTEEMLASINRLAEEMVGETVINTRAGFAPPAIARDHQRTIKKVIETYEYLSE